MAGTQAHSSAARPAVTLLKVIYRTPSLPLHALPLHRARRRIPSGVAGLLLELRTDHERLAQIHRIRGGDGDHHQGISVGFLDQIEILRHRCVVAVRHAVLAEETGLYMVGLDLERAVRCSSPRAALPFRGGIALQRIRPRGGFPSSEMKEPRLFAGVGFEL